MEVNVNWPAYHGRLDTNAAIARLRTIDRPGSYLVRWKKKDFLISFINEKGEIKHKILNFARNSSLRQANPGLMTPQRAFEFLTSIDLQRYAYLVSWRDFDEPVILPSSQDQGIVCHCCDKSFREEKELCIHLAIHKESYCQTCQSMVPYRGFYNHKKKCQERPKHLRCHLCTFSTSYNHSLKQHMETFHGKASAQCTICDKHFRDASSLEKHMKSHMGYDCSDCGRNFRTKWGRDRHVMSNHANDNDDPQSSADLPQTSSGVSEEDLLTPPSSPSRASHSPPDPGPGHEDNSQGQGGGDLGPAQPSQPSSPIHFGPQNMPSDFVPAAHSTPKRGFFGCHICTYKGHSQKRLRRHIKLKHQRPPPLYACKHCKDSKNPFVTKSRRNLKYHQKHKCLGVARVPVVLEPDELWDIISDVGISNRAAEKLLTGLCKKLGYRFVPKGLRKCLSESLNSFRRFVTCETLSFKTKSGDVAEPTTLVYTKDLASVIDTIIEARQIKSPHINIAIDGSIDKVIVVLQVMSSRGFLIMMVVLISFIQVYDLDDLLLTDAQRKEKNKKEPLGRDRSIVIARGDYTVESPENIQLIYEKLKLRECMQKYFDWHIIGDLKAHNSTCGMYQLLINFFFHGLLFLI